MPRSVKLTMLLRHRRLLSIAAATRARAIASVTGMPPGPLAGGVTTMQFDDSSRIDATSGGPRKLQTEIWYPAAAEAASQPRNLYSEYLGRGVIPALGRSGEPRRQQRQRDEPLAERTVLRRWHRITSRGRALDTVGCWFHFVGSSDPRLAITEMFRDQKAQTGGWFRYSRAATIAPLGAHGGAAAHALPAAGQPVDELPDA